MDTTQETSMTMTTTHHDPDRLRALAADLWHEVFLTLDTELYVTGEEAGRAATAAEHAILAALGLDTPAAGVVAVPVD